MVTVRDADLVLSGRWLTALLKAGGEQAPRLTRALERGPAQRLDAVSWTALLARRFGVATAGTWSPALLSWYGEALLAPTAIAALPPAASAPEGATERWCWRADPVCLAPGMDALQLAVTAPDLALSRDETDALVSSLCEHFAPEAIEFRAPVPDRWYLHAAEPLDAVAPPARALRGRNIQGALPAGPGARRLIALMNECQMVLGDHPVNQAREARGLPAVNSVWFWGGGRDGDFAPPAEVTLPALTTAAPDVAGLWHLAGAGARVTALAGRRAEDWLAPPEVATAGRLVVLDDDVAAVFGHSAGGDGVPHADHDGVARVAPAMAPVTPDGDAATLDVRLAAALERAFDGWLARRPRRGGAERRGCLTVIGGGWQMTTDGRAPWWRRARRLATRLNPRDEDWWPAG